MNWIIIYTLVAWAVGAVALLPRALREGREMRDMTMAMVGLVLWPLSVAMWVGCGWNNVRR
jgi:hypothetical protein